MGKFSVGQAVPRTEDPRLLQGRGQYVDDIRLLGECHAYMLRSPPAHARILGIAESPGGSVINKRRAIPCG